MQYFRFTKAALATIAISIVASTIGVKTSSARDVLCMTEKKAAVLFRHKWASISYVSNHRRHKGRLQYLKSGKTIFVNKDGQVFNQGTWKRKGKTVYRYEPTRLQGKRYSIRIKKSCK